MKNLIIKRQSIQLTNLEAEMYRKLLQTLNIQFEQADQPEPQVEYTVVDLMDLVNVRVRNILLNMVPDRTMQVSQFVETYTVCDFLKYRNAGRKSLDCLRSALEDMGFIW